MTRLKFERTNRRLSQRRLANAARLHQPELSQIERGRLVPTPEELERLAEVLHVDASELMTRVVLGPSR